MIQEFSVKNYRSIKERQTLSFLANKRFATGFEEHLCVTVAPGVELLKLILLYGHNASGKSNMMHALEFLRDVALGRDESEFTPFFFDEEYRKSPGEFSLTFYINGIKYKYSISIDRERVYEEELLFWPHGRPSLLYGNLWDAEKGKSKLKAGSAISLRAADKRMLEEKVLEHRSVLATYGESNFFNERLEEVKEFFRNHFLQSINSKRDLSELIADRDGSNLKTTLLKRADLQIRGYEEESDELLFAHETSYGRFSLPAKEESAGTQRYFGLTGIIGKLIQGGHSIAIDELETSLHPDLVNYLVEVFLINSSNSQILTTTHAQYLLESDYIRRDMIWFCEKGGDGGSEYYSAQDFGLHKNINLRNFYRAGKLGGAPILGSPLIEGEK